MIAIQTTEIEKKYFFTFWFFVVAYFLWNLGGYDLTAPDEPRFALVAREALENNHWFVIYRNGYPYPDKPPLFFWCISLFSFFAGEVNAWTARLPSALAAIGILITIYRFVKIEVSQRVGLYSVALIATTVSFFYQARMAQIDMFLCFFVVLSTLSLYWTVQQKMQKTWLIGLLMGLGTMAKGPVAILLPLGSIVTYCLLNKKSLKTIPWRSLYFCVGLLACWLTPMILIASSTGNIEYVHNILFKQTVVRYANAWHHHQPFYYFLETIWHDGFPWIFLFALLIPFKKKSFKSLPDLTKFCLSAVFFMILFFSLSKGKRNLYILPVYPFIGIYVSIFLDQFFRNKGHIKKFVRFNMISLILFSLVGFALVILKFLAPKFPKFSTYTETLPYGELLCGGLIALIIGLVGIFFWVKKKYTSSYLSFIVLFSVIVFILYQTVLPWLDQYRSVRSFMAKSTAIMKADNPDYEVGMVDFRAEFRFYGEKNILELNDASGGSKNGEIGIVEYWRNSPKAWVLIRQSYWENYKEKQPKLNGKVYFEQALGKNKIYYLMRQDLLEK